MPLCTLCCQSSKSTLTHGYNIKSSSGILKAVVSCVTMVVIGKLLHSTFCFRQMFDLGRSFPRV